MEPITRPIELQSQPPFLLYRNQRSAISGFWFYCKEDCVRIHALLEKLIKKASTSNKGDSGVQQQQQQNPHHQQQQGQVMNHQNGKSDVDIFSMLSKAQAEFNVTANGCGVEQQLADMKINQLPSTLRPQQQNLHQPLMKQISSTMPDITSPNVVNFFAAAQQPNGVIPIINDAPRPFMQGIPVPHHHHPMQQQPPVQTLDEIEKQHRVPSVSPKVEPKLLNNLLNSSIQQQQHQPEQQPLKLLQQQSIPAQQQQMSAPKLLAPTMFQASAVEEKEKIVMNPPIQQQQQQSQPFRPEPLTHNQLIQALNYLLENDPDFIRKIHEAYIKSFNKIVSH